MKKIMSNKIRKSYKQSKNIYDDVLTQGKWWSRDRKSVV